MENHIKNIELINNYLKKKLSENEIQNFENRLKTDSDFNNLLDEHKTFLEGLKRQQLKSEIIKAKRAHVNAGLLKVLGVSIAVIISALLAYVIISNTSKEPILNQNLKNNSLVIDTIPSEKTLDPSIKTEKAIILKDSISSKKEIETLKPIQNADISFKKSPQKLKINTEKDTVVVCKEGTKLVIKANSFIDSKDNLINGTIDLNVTEYYKLSDMLLANLSTTSNGKQLETGGMLHLEAFSGSEPLKLKSSIEISFPTKHKKENMQLFSGVWKNGNVNWNLQEEVTEEVTINSIEIDEEDVDVPFSVVEEPPIYPGCENLDEKQRKQCTSTAINQFVQRNFNTNIAGYLNLTGRQRVNSIFKINKYGNVSSIQSRGTHPRIEEEANRVIALMPKMQPGKQRGRVVAVPYSLPIIFTIPEDGKTITARFGSVNSSFNNTIEMDTIFTSTRGQVELIREVMHDKDFQVDSTFIETWETYGKAKLIRFYGENNNVILRKSLFEMENTEFKVLEDDSITRGGHIIRKPWDESQIPTTSIIMKLVPKENIYIGREKITKEEFENRLQDKEDVSVRANDVTNYVLRSLELGWINCDRFIRGRSRIKYKLKIKNAHDTNVNMVFKSVNSILRSRRFGEEFDFNMVSKNEDVTLVAIKKQEGKLYLDIIDAKTEENPNLEFNFKEVSLEEMKKELETLNTLF